MERTRRKGASNYNRQKMFNYREAYTQNMCRETEEVEVEQVNELDPEMFMMMMYLCRY